MSELLPRCTRALSAADVRRCLREALDAPSADGPTFREWYGSFFVFARDAPTLVIGISGCTRSGKSTLASALAEALGASKTAVIRQDRFASNVLAAQAEGGWESTDSIDFKAFRDAVVEDELRERRVRLHPPLPDALQLVLAQLVLHEASSSNQPPAIDKFAVMARRTDMRGVVPLQ